ncbi:cytochrome c oxidase subunit 3 [Mycolicibacterium sp. XJ1819]
MSNKAEGMTEERPRATATNASVRHIPGEPGIWVFIFLELLIFAWMFGIFVWHRAENRELFEASRQAVDPVYGLAYTILLLASSWCVVTAVAAAKKRLVDAASKLIWLAFAFGAAFILIKVVDYAIKMSGGITPFTNDFFMLFYVITFIHFLHVLAGLGVLTYMRSQARALGSGVSLLDDKRIGMVEVGGIFWHFVDLLWLVMFALFYLRG